jgi:hypothetical protein
LKWWTSSHSTLTPEPLDWARLCKLRIIPMWL